MESYEEYIYSSGTHYISNSGHDENGKYSSGSAGDQTGDEWCLRSWYNRPWNCVLRYPDADVALLIAQLGCAAALNDKIGYDQNQRDSYWEQLQKAGYDPSKITTACEADCSAGIIANVKAAGYLLGTSALQKVSATYTGNMRSAFKSAGFEVLTADKYLSGHSYLKPGDILLNDSAHTATNVTKGANATFSPSSEEGDTEMTDKIDPATLWEFLMGEIGNAYGVAGLMGNLYAESALIPINLENAYESKLGYTDTTYTQAVDDGAYKNFGSDSAGYGLAQWTYSSRKKNLLSYAQGKGVSIGNGAMQMNFLIKELSEEFPSLLSSLKTATSVKDASDAVLTKFEQPADQGDTVKNVRAAQGQAYYDAYVGSSSKTVEELAQEVLAGKWGNDPERSVALKAAGYDAEAVQARVNEIKGVGGSSDTKGATVATASKFEDGCRNGVAYRVTATSGLNVRYGPDKSTYGVITALTYGTQVTYYGYYDKDASGTKWMLVIANGITGWACSSYLKKS